MQNLPQPRFHSASSNVDEAQRERTRSFNDILEWLALVFGFQVTFKFPSCDFVLSFCPVKSVMINLPIFHGERKEM